MRSLDSKARTHHELAELLESQLNTLEKEVFGCVTEAELGEYEERRDRICQLYGELFVSRSSRIVFSAGQEEITK